MLGVIGGTGLYRLFEGKKEIISTPYGPTTLIRCGREHILFCPRHGLSHETPPHAINHRANIHALSSRCQAILSFSSVGIIQKFSMGDLVLVEDFIGLFLPSLTFFIDTPVHTPFSSPYPLNPLVITAARNARVRLKRGGILAGTVGPRLETPAEIRFLRMAGANVVGMTSIHEAVLARERNIPFANVVVCCNKAPARESDSLESLSRVMREATPNLHRLALTVAKAVPHRWKE